MKRHALASLRVRLMLLVLIGAIPALGFILYIGWSQRSFATKLMQDDALRVVRLAAMEQEQLVGGTRHLLMALAQLPELRKRDLAAAGAILKRIQTENLPVYANLGLIDLSGETLLSAIPLSGKTNLKDRSYFQQALATGDFSIGGYQVGRITRQPTVNFGYPVHDMQGRINGVIFAAVDLDWLGQMIADAKLPHDTAIHVIEKNGTVLASYPKNSQLIGKKLPITSLARAIASQTEGTQEAVGPGDASRLYAFTNLSRQPNLGGLYVIVGIPLRIAYAEAHRTLVWNLLGLALAATLALLAAWFGGDLFILSRVRNLLQATRRLAAGDLGARTGVDYGMGEFGELAHAFDEMAGALQTRAEQRDRAERDLKALNEVLEERVEERTQELQERTRQIEADLEMARELQEAFLPHQPPGALRLVSAGGATLQFFHRYHPTGKVGGDFFDVLTLPGGKAGVFICDVMGQGIRAALVTAILRGLVEELKPIAHRAGDFMTQINRGLCAVFRQTGAPMFATAFYLIADAENGVMEYANAGHPSPLLVCQNDCEVQPLIGGGGPREPALGLIESFEYPASRTLLQNGDLVILYTDGLYEVENPADEEFGIDRLVDAVQQRIMLPPMLLFDDLIAEIQRYSSTHEFTDDVCLVGMQVARRPVAVGGGG